MKKQDRLRALIGLVAIIAVVVGVLVYPPPKEVKADTYFNVYCWWLNGESHVPIAEDEISVQFCFDANNNNSPDDGWSDPTSQGLGTYTYQRAGNFVTWWVRYSNEGETEYWGVSPSANPGNATSGGSSTYLDWQFAFVM